MPRQSNATSPGKLLKYVFPLLTHEKEKQVSTWVIGYRNADRSEHQITADAAGVLTEQGAAMLVSDYLRQQQLAKDGGQMATEQYNFQIIRIHQIPGDAESA
jgi:hypothetical protein